MDFSMTDTNKKVVILGANGQVASEIILEMKKQNPHVDIIGVCRNKLGSLFLRYNKIRIVHASLESDDFPVELLKNADMVVNTIYVKANPAEVKKRHENILRKIFVNAGSKTKIVHFSTVAVFQDTIYANEKSHQDKLIKKLAKRYRKSATILRLGHVLGPNQRMSSLYLDLAKNRNKMFLPNAGNNDANCVSVKYITEVILDILKKERNESNSNVYITVFNPVVTWVNIFNLFNATNIEFYDFSPGHEKTFRNILNLAFNGVRNNRSLHRLSLKIVRHLPLFLEKKIYARHLLSKAQQDINALFTPQYSTQPVPMFQVPAIGERYPISRSITREELLP